MTENNFILNCEGISKAFGGTQALKDVQLHVRAGEVHALLGENGAGKSTLMKIVIGLIRQDTGTMEFEGQPYQANGPVDALNSGISMIHQELNPEPYLTVAESIFLKRESTKGFLLDKKTQNEKCEALLRKFDVPYTAKTMMKDLTLAQIQMVEIIKAVSCDARLIIMDVKYSIVLIVYGVYRVKEKRKIGTTYTNRKKNVYDVILNYWPENP